MYLTHNMSHSSEYTTYYAMLSRCYSPKSASYNLYGGRGISVCDRWKKSFNNFYEDMGKKPTGTSLGRINNNSGYSPENCRWETTEQQKSNKRNSRKIKYFDKFYICSELSKILNINKGTIRSRIQAGWSDEKITSTKVTPKTKRKEKN